MYTQLNNDDILVISIINNYMSLLSNGMGGINSHGLALIADALDLSEDVVDKLILSINTIIYINSEEVADGNQ